MHTQNEIITTFGEMAGRYEDLMNNELNRFWGISYAGFVDQLVSSLQTNGNERILDIATGTGFIPQFLIDNDTLFKKINGLDITFDMLLQAQKNFGKGKQTLKIDLFCASAHAIPIKNNTYDVVTCCLATHHMDVSKLLENSYACLKDGGKLHVADVGGSNKWKIRSIKFMIKILAFVYFLFVENYSRAIAESSAIANVYTVSDWRSKIEAAGFKNIKIEQVKSKRFWVPSPIMLKAQK